MDSIVTDFVQLGGKRCVSVQGNDLGLKVVHMINGVTGKRMDLDGGGQSDRD